MKSKFSNLIEAQDAAVAAICALRIQSNPYKHSRSKRLPRSVAAIYRRYAAYAASVGCTNVMITQAWRDIIDMVVLADNAEE